MNMVFDSVNASQLTLPDLLRWRAQHSPLKEAYTYLLNGETKQVQMTYADLDREARRIAALLQDRTHMGERVLLLYPSGLEYVAAIFGCFYANIVAVPAYPPRANQSLMRIQAILQDAEVTVVLTTAKTLSSMRRTFASDPLMQNLHWIETDTLAQERASSYRECHTDWQALALLQYTSGSMGSPKGVMLTHTNLVQNAALIQEGMSLSSEDRGMVWLPPYHDMGLMAGILQSLYTGYSMILMAPAAFVQQPLRWLQAISSFRITASGGPNFAYDLCVKKATEDAIKTLDLSSWTLAFTGAEPVRAETLERFAATFAPCGFRPEAFYPCYGLAETTLFVSGGQRRERPRIGTFEGGKLETGYAVETKGDEGTSRPLVGCGSVREGQEVAIVDPERRTRLADGTIGEIWVRGPNVGQGYWGKEKATAETFQAFLSEGDEGPFLRTGDLGFCVEGEIYVTGRFKDLIIIRGRNLHPQDIEQVVGESHSLLRPGFGAAFGVEGRVLGLEESSGERLVVVQEVGRHCDEVGAHAAIQAIRQVVLSAFDVEVAAIELLRAGTILKTTSGKIQRQACRSGFLAGELKAVYHWSRTQENTPGQGSNHEKMPPNRVGTAACPCPPNPANTVIIGSHGQGQAAVPTRFTPTVQEVVDWLIMHIADRVHMDARVVDLHAPFVQFGLNSLDAIGLSGALEQWLGCSLSPTLVYDYPTIFALAHYLAEEGRRGEVSGRQEPLGSGSVLDQSLQQTNRRESDAIAVIGLGCRFPGAENPEAFWQMLHDGIDGISLVPASRWDAEKFYAPDQATPGKMNSRWGGFLSHIEQFDCAFFAISPREAAQMDPQQRLLLEVAWETLEQAAMAPDKLAGSQTGVFIGISSGDYSREPWKDPAQIDAYTGTGNAHSIAANRLSYTLDLRGPSMAIDTACSSSLVAVHQACLSLRYGECDLALAGGVNVILAPELTITFSQARMMSSDGRCRTFDEAADGYVRSEGCGLVLLKPLADALRDGDRILSIIRGSAMNQDGRSNGLTAPNGPSQEAVIRRALQHAGVHPDGISYVETHGSGTPLGDRIEVDALKAVLTREHRPDQPCLLGAVKTNIGHLEAAAGIVGLMKTVLCLQKGVIVPNLHFKRLNPHISLAGTPFEIPTEPRAWPGSPDAPHFAGVSAFGFGGTNVHLILEGAPQALAGGSMQSSAPDSPIAESLAPRSLHLLTLSGRTAQALTVLAQRYQDFLRANETVSLSDLCFTAYTGRTHFTHRLAVSAENTQQMRERLAAFVAGQAGEEMQIGTVRGYRQQGGAGLAFLFTGQGSQYVNMGRQLYETQPIFRQALDECDRLLRPLLPQDYSFARSLRAVLYPASGASSPLDETAYTQLALFALEYALAQMWLSWGIKPDVVMGHSVGEYVAACVAGLFSLEDSLKLLTARGHLMQSLPEHGTMAVIFAAPERVQSFVAPYAGQVAIAALNGPKNTVISGSEEAVQLMVQQFAASGVRTHALSVSHAFHSPLMDPMLDAFELVAREVMFAPLRLPLVCNLTGQLIPAGEVLDAHYWRRQTRETVQFATGIQQLFSQGYELFLEVGPTPVLSNLGKRCLPVGLGSEPCTTSEGRAMLATASTQTTWLSSLRQDYDDWHILMQSVASLYCKGYHLNWSGFDGDGVHRKLALPTYPFEREYCWFKSQKTQTVASPLPVPTVRSDIQNEINKWLYQLRWEARDLPLSPPSMQAGHWLIFLDRKGIGQRLALQLQALGHTCSLIEAGENFQIINQERFQINPAQPQEIKHVVGTAIATVRPSGQARWLPLHGVIHLWSLDATPVEALTLTTLEADQILGVQSALSLIQALVEQSVQTRLWLITQGAQPVSEGRLEGAGRGQSPSLQTPQPLQPPAFPYADLAVSQAPIWGLGKTCALEHPDIWGGLIDLDPDAICGEGTCPLATVLQGDLGEDQIALRGTKMYVARMVRVEVGLTPARPLHLSPDAAYLITGGLWGLGLEVARWLALQGARHLILLGRSKLPPRETWDQVLPESRMDRQIAGIRSVERLGAKVYAVSVDVTDEAQVVAFLDHWERGDWASLQPNSYDNQQLEQPPIRGVIHAAAVWQDAQKQPSGQAHWLLRPLSDLNAADLTTVLRPKMLGAWLLTTLFQKTSLDFFVSFSSLTSLFGSAAMGHYAAANEFLDVLAYYQRAHGQAAMSINWGPIAEIGIGATSEALPVYEYWESRGIERLSPQQFLAALELLLPQDLAHIGVLRLGWQLLQQFYPQMTSLPLLRYLVAIARADGLGGDRPMAQGMPVAQGTQATGENALQTLQEAHVQERYVILTTYIQKKVANVLHIPADKLDTEQSLITLGFDSLMALELKNSLELELQINIPVITLLQGPSIAFLVNQILTLEGPWIKAVGVEQRQVSGRQGATPCPQQPSVPASTAHAPDANATVSEPPDGARTAASLVSTTPTYLPLSYNQKALWFLCRLAPESADFNLLYATRIRQRLDIPALHRALLILVDRDPVLTSTYTLQNGEPVQQIQTNQTIPLEEIDASSMSLNDLKQQLLEESNQPIDLTKGPLLRLTLYRRSDDDYVLGFIIHHIMVDFWALNILVEELFLLYLVEKTSLDELSGKTRPSGQAQWLQEADFRHADYVRWQQSMLQSQEGELHRQYWQNTLAGDLPVLHLPTDRPRPPLQTHRGASYSFPLSTDLEKKVRTLASIEKVTPFTLMLTAYQVLLYRYTNQDDILVGTPALGRTRPELERVIGYLANPTVVRTRIGHNPTFKDLLHQTKQSVLEALEHQDFPLPLLTERLQAHRDLSYSPIYQAFFTWNRLHTHYGKDLTRLEQGTVGAGQDQALSLEAFVYGQQGAPFDLSLTIYEIEGQLSADLRYNVELFDADTIARMAEHFLTLLDSIINHPDQHILELPLLPVHEYNTILFERNATHSPYPDTTVLHQLIEAQVEKTPEQTALIFEGQALTYQQLNREANQLAHQLQKAAGRGLVPLQPDTLVGVCMERSLEMVVSLLAILKAGGAYLPLDPAFPEERLAYMIQDVEVAVVLTQSHLRGCLRETSVTIIVVDPGWNAQIEGQEDNPVSAVQPDHLAYVIYTSGSTGQPKGVMNTHRGICNRLHWMQQAYQLTQEDRILQKTPFSFDVSVWEFFWPLLTGATVVVARPGGHQDPAYLKTLIAEEQVTMLHFVPSMLQAFLWDEPTYGTRYIGYSKPPLESCTSLRQVICSGEALSAELQANFFAHVAEEVQLQNLYGPTEAAIDVTFWSCQREEGHRGFNRVPIGCPIANTQIYLLNKNLQLVPIGVTGELYIGGVGLARGYYKQPEQTAERFIPNPFAGTGPCAYMEPGTRLYHTGDLARYRADGALEYLGRIDHQVKLRGFRIELGEIEAVLSQHPSIQECVVILREESEARKYLVAYVALAATPLETADKSPDASQMQGYLRERLPDYMVPTHFVFLDRLPTTANGKIDRRALPTPADLPSEQRARFVGPRTPLEELLTHIWMQVLGTLEQVSISANFFALGGHSLLATQVVSRIRQAVQIELPLHVLFEGPTIAELAQQIEARLREQLDLALPALIPNAHSSACALSFAQERLWFLHQLEPESALYNMASALRLTGQLRVDALERSLARVVQRHEVLRTTFAVQQDHPVQIIAPSLAMQIAVIDLLGIAALGLEAQVAQLARAETQRSFDLAQGPLLRVYLLRLAPEGRPLVSSGVTPQEHVLLFTLHHIVTDGWSMEVLVREMTTLYQAQVNGEPELLPELPIQYADYALWQRQFLQGDVLGGQLAYWRKQLADLSPLTLPTDHRRPAVKTDRGASQSRLLPPALSQELLGLCQKRDVTLFMLLLSTFQVLLMRYTGQTDISVGTPIANRTRAELEGLIGFFVNTLVMRTDLSGNPTFEHVLRGVREVCLQAYVDQDIPFEKLVEDLEPERDMSRSPLFQVMLVLQNTPLGTVPVQDLAGVSVTPLEVVGTTSKFDLTLYVTEVAPGLVPGGLDCVLEYSTDLFEAASITRMLAHFQTLLEGIVQNPQALLSDFPLLTEEEQEHLLVQWNATKTDSPRQVCVHQLFEQQAEQTPDTIAVVFEDETLTYAELNRRANQLAHYLHHLGVGPEVLVGVSLSRSIEMVVGLLAVLKAGGAYVPLDSSYPEERLAWIQADSEIEVILTHQHEDGYYGVAQSINLETDWQVIAKERPENPQTSMGSAYLAYLMYTSGSTGQPKGVQISHRAVINFLTSMRRQLDLTREETLLAVTPLSFDIAGLELFLPLVIGARVVVARQEVARDGERLGQALIEHGATMMQATPATWRLLLNADGLAPGTLRMLCGGETLPPDLAEQLLNLGGAVWNLYGPTETTIWSTVYAVESLEEQLPIGRPIGNTQIYLLDRNLSPVPIGVGGELYIGGEGLARGYWKRPDLTAERFIANPWRSEPGARLYRTGDLARYRPDGTLEYLGRIDRQVKLRGFRIELGEIEALLMDHPAVQDSIVIAREEESGEKRLVAYVIASSPSSIQPASLPSMLRDYLKEKLPKYIVPAAIVLLERLPLTTNGKVDRSALPIPDLLHSERQETFVAPRTPVEKVLAGIWEDVLGLERVGIHDDFFEIGGHSLLATQVVAQIHETLQVALPLREIFEAPTVAEIAVLLLHDPDQSVRLEKTARIVLELSTLSDSEIEAIMPNKLL